jgi:hypothetical protein
MAFLPSFRRKPESSNFRALQAAWTLVFTGVTTLQTTFISAERHKAAAGLLKLASRLR